MGHSFVRVVRARGGGCQQRSAFPAVEQCSAPCTEAVSLEAGSVRASVGQPARLTTTLQRCTPLAPAYKLTSPRRPLEQPLQQPAGLAAAVQPGDCFCFIVSGTALCNLHRRSAHVNSASARTRHANVSFARDPRCADRLLSAADEVTAAGSLPIGRESTRPPEFPPLLLTRHLVCHFAALKTSTGQFHASCLLHIRCCWGS